MGPGTLGFAQRSVILDKLAKTQTQSCRLPERPARLSRCVSCVDRNSILLGGPLRRTAPFVGTDRQVDYVKLPDRVVQRHLQHWRWPDFASLDELSGSTEALRHRSRVED